MLAPYSRTRSENVDAAALSNTLGYFLVILDDRIGSIVLAKHKSD